MWVGLNWIFFDPPWWFGSKNHLNPTQLDPCTPLSTGQVYTQLGTNSTPLGGRSEDLSSTETMIKSILVKLCTGRVGFGWNREGNGAWRISSKPSNFLKISDKIVGFLQDLGGDHDDLHQISLEIVRSLLDLARDGCIFSKSRWNLERWCDFRSNFW